MARMKTALSPRFLTTNELAAFLNISSRQVYRLREAGLPVVVVGQGAVRYDPAAVEAWILAHQPPAAAKSPRGRPRHPFPGAEAQP